jgi:hypothetical protein
MPLHGGHEVTADEIAGGGQLVASAADLVASCVVFVGEIVGFADDPADDAVRFWVVSALVGAGVR